MKQEVGEDVQSSGTAVETVGGDGLRRLGTGDGGPATWVAADKNKRPRRAGERGEKQVVFGEDEDKSRRGRSAVPQTGDGVAAAIAGPSPEDKEPKATCASALGAKVRQVANEAGEAASLRPTDARDAASTGDGERSGALTSPPTRTVPTSPPTRTVPMSPSTRTVLTSPPTRTVVRQETAAEGHSDEMNRRSEVSQHGDGNVDIKRGEGGEAEPPQPREKHKKPGLVEPPEQKRRADKGRRPIEKPGRAVKRLRFASQPMVQTNRPVVRGDDVVVHRDEEVERQRLKSEKRKLRASIRKARQQHKTEMQAALEQIATVAGATSTGDNRTETVPRRLVEPGVMAEQDYEMPGPSPEFQDALQHSEEALRARHKLAARLDELKEGYARLALAEAERGELLAAGNVVGDNGVRDGVADQLVTAAAGLELLG